MSRKATVLVAGYPLNTIGNVESLEWTRKWDYDGICGPFSASWKWSVGPQFAAGWFREGASVQVVDQGRLRWGGRLSEPQANDGVIECHAVGYGQIADTFEAVTRTGSPPVYTPTYLPDDAIDAAIARGLPWIRPASIGATSVAVNGVTETVETLVLRAAKREGKRANVDSRGIVTLASDPTTATWLLGGMSDYLGTVDDEFITRLFGYYVSGVDGSGNPNAWSMVYAEDAVVEAKFGQTREKTVDLTALGLLMAATAQADVDGRFALTGARMGWTSGFVAGPNLRLVSGERADPAAVQAGQIVRIPGVRDSRSGKKNLAAVEITLGETRHVADENITYCTPLGYVPRDFSSALAAAQKPTEVKETA